MRKEYLLHNEMTTFGGYSLSLVFCEWNKFICDEAWDLWTSIKSVYLCSDISLQEIQL